MVGWGKPPASLTSLAKCNNGAVHEIPFVPSHVRPMCGAGVSMPVRECKTPANVQKTVTMLFSNNLQCASLTFDRSLPRAVRNCSAQLQCRIPDLQAWTQPSRKARSHTRCARSSAQSRSVLPRRCMHVGNDEARSSQHMQLMMACDEADTKH